EAAVASAGMGLFGLSVHSGLPWILLSGVGLLATTLAIAHSFRAGGSLTEIFALLPLSRKGAFYLGLGCAVGSAFGIFFRVYQDVGTLPTELGRFVFVAAAIGAAEEVLFRGYVQGGVRRLGSMAGVTLTAAAHTLYKLALFALPPEGIVIDYEFLAIWTFIGGVIFGGLREFSDSVLPPLCGHVSFDIVVYGQRAHAPWWVWS
ncbi:MAG: CPBP family intramembrane metalloprotease, partial [Proteobacteria bacterium]|nr:CPBP family intramembrane metalloprotease [Pseudomonadota bacterium]